MQKNPGEFYDSRMPSTGQTAAEYILRKRAGILVPSLYGPQSCAQAVGDTSAPSATPAVRPYAQQYTETKNDATYTGIQQGYLAERFCTACIRTNTDYMQRQGLQHPYLVRFIEVVKVTEKLAVRRKKDCCFPVL